MVKKSLGILLSAALLVWSSTSTYAQVAVTLEGGTGLDPCSGVQIYGLNPRGDGFLAIRSGPGTNYRKIGELYNGNIVAGCDYRRGWYGIVYGGRDCGTGSPIARTAPYRGPCRSGWVYGKYVRVVAG